MDIADALPNDPTECQSLLLAAFKEATEHERRVTELEQRLAASTQRVTESEQQVAELNRVLDETAASFEELRQNHAAALEELALLKRWIHGQRRERIVENEGQQHLFEVGDDAHPYSVYDFTMSRSRDGPQKFLTDFSGYLHADAYAGYDAIFLESKSKIVEVACWAHARRKFFDAVKSYPRQSHQILEWIWQLYDIEDLALPLTAAARCDLRCAEANPVLDKIEAYLAELKPTVLPKSSLAKAITYAQNQWGALRTYTTDGRLTIDNNTSERTLRPQAVGRRNWLFLGSENAGSRAAILYTILAGAKRHHIEPWAYVRDILVRLREDDVQLGELLPDRWAAGHPESILTHRIEEARYKANAKRDRRQQRRATAKACGR